MREVHGGVRAVTCPVRDLDASRVFYLERLGLAEVAPTTPSAVTINVGTFRLRLVPASRTAPVPGPGLALTFRVDDISRTAAELERRGVPFEALTGGASGEHLVVHDPDGHRLVFTRRV